MCIPEFKGPAVQSIYQIFDVKSIVYIALKIHMYVDLKLSIGFACEHVAAAEVRQAGCQLDNSHLELNLTALATFFQIAQHNCLHNRKLVQ